MNHAAPHPRPEVNSPGKLPPLPTPTGADMFWGATSLVTGLIGAVAGAILADRVMGLAGADVLAVLLIGGGLGMWLPLIWGVIRRRGWSLQEIGFRRGRHSLLHLIYQIPVAILGSGFLALLVGPALQLTPAGGSHTGQSLEASPLLALGAAAMIVLVIPLAEELLFRRILLDWLISKMPVVAAGAIVVVVFAAAHLSPPVMLYILFLGTALTCMRLWYGNLWAPLILHMCNNGLITAITLLVIFLR